MLTTAPSVNEQFDCVRRELLNVDTAQSLYAISCLRTLRDAWDEIQNVAPNRRSGPLKERCKNLVARLNRAIQDCAGIDAITIDFVDPPKDRDVSAEEKDVHDSIIDVCSGLTSGEYDDSCRIVDVPIVSPAIDNPTGGTPQLDDQENGPEILAVTLPAPIAIPYQRFRAEPDPRQKFKLLCLTVQSMVRYLVTLGLCDLLHCLAKTPGKTDEVLSDSLFDFLREPNVVLALGRWKRVLTEVASKLSSYPDRFFEDFPKLCGHEGVFIDIIEDMIGERNLDVHPDAEVAYTKDQCRRLIRDTRSGVETALQKLWLVRENLLGFVVDARAQRGSLPAGGDESIIYSCMGDGLDRQRTLIGSYKFQDQPFVVDRRGTRILYLWPFLLQAKSLHRKHALYRWEEIPNDDGRFLASMNAANVETREPLWIDWREKFEWPVDQRTRQSNHDWLLGEYRERFGVKDMPSDLMVREKLKSFDSKNLEGKTIIGLNVDYQLVHAIGEGNGALSEVYVARRHAKPIENCVKPIENFAEATKNCAESTREVAIKVMELREDASLLRRLQEEFKTTRDARECPGIIEVHEEGTFAGDSTFFYWYSMQLGVSSLKTRLRERRDRMKGSFPWQNPELRVETIQEFTEITEAVAYLHSHQIVHRDIKPGNIIIVEQMDGTTKLKLADFGLVKKLNPSDETWARHQRTETGAVIGTEVYRAPELESGDANNAKETADVYSLGIVLAHLITGDKPISRRPKTGGSTLRDWLRHQKKRCKQLPSRFLEKCTQLEPGKRYRDATEALDAFRKDCGASTDRGLG